MMVLYIYLKVILKEIIVVYVYITQYCFNYKAFQIIMISKRNKIRHSKMLYVNQYSINTFIYINNLYGHNYGSH